MLVCLIVLVSCRYFLTHSSSLLRKLVLKKTNFAVHTGSSKFETDPMKGDTHIFGGRIFAGLAVLEFVRFCGSRVNAGPNSNHVLTFQCNIRMCR